MGSSATRESLIKRLLLGPVGRGMPWLLLGLAVTAAACHLYAAAVARRAHAARSEVAQLQETRRAQQEQARRLAAGRQLLEGARREGLDAGSYLFRGVSYRNVALPAGEANQVLDRTLNGGIDSIVSVQEFRLAAGRPGQALWGGEGLGEQDAVVLTLVGEQFFKAARP